MNYRESWDLSTIPDDVLMSEWGRRARMKQPHAPRPKVLRPCPKCGKECGARELRLHIPKCNG